MILDCGAMIFLYCGDKQDESGDRLILFSVSFNSFESHAFSDITGLVLLNHALGFQNFLSVSRPINLHKQFYRLNVYTQVSLFIC